MTQNTDVLALDASADLFKAEKQKRKATLGVWFVFVLSLVVVLGVRWYEVRDASKKISTIASMVEATWIEDTSAATVVDQVIEDFFGDEVDEEIVADYRNLLLLLAYDMGIKRHEDSKSKSIGEPPQKPDKNLDAKAETDSIEESSTGQDEQAAATGDPKPTVTGERDPIPGVAQDSSAEPEAQQIEAAPALSEPDATPEGATAAEDASEAEPGDKNKVVDEKDPETPPADSWSAEAVRMELRPRQIVSGLVLVTLVGIFPAAFQVRTRQALKQLRKTPKRPKDYWDAVWYHRNKHFLEDESRLFFWRRLGFASLVSVSALYLLSPAGLEASAVGEYARSISLPGSMSYPFWFTDVARASPFVIGLAGYLLYSMTVFTRRALTRDISNRLFLSLWNRGLIVVILSLVLTGIDAGSNISRALIFVAGVFPQTGIQAIGRVAQAGADRLSQMETRGFAEIPEIDLLKESSLQEVGVFDTNDLATANLSWLQEVTGIEPRVLLRAADRAVLHFYLDIEAAKKLATLPALTASELVLFVYGQAAYGPRWEAAGVKHPHPIGLELDKSGQQKQLDKVNHALGAQDVSVMIEELMNNQTVIYILDNRVSYGDI